VQLPFNTRLRLTNDFTLAAWYLGHGQIEHA
jgi:hypothetical protein